MLVVAALNGGRSRVDHPAVPVSPEQLAAATIEAAAAGAGAVHFHVRGGDGRESLAAADVARAVTAVRKHGVPLGVSTGAWIISNPAQRLAIVGEWTVLPDFVSVNFDEEGATELAAFLLGRNVALEVGIANRFAAEELVGSGLADRCLRIMFEPREQSVAGAMTSVEEAESVLDAAGARTPRLLHGVDATAWPLVDAARDRGYDTRIGFEDTLALPGGEVAAGNGELVRAAWAICHPERSEGSMTRRMPPSLRSG
ncbi:MAG: 3-keto-5-aminohexanoate cleavage protein [Gemmatimonadales bacterium]|nr:3-keto-5-aminohexanoate cleavage protein [Gemmatimonadales bacterium]